MFDLSFPSLGAIFLSVDRDFAHTLKSIHHRPKTVEEAWQKDWEAIGGDMRKVLNTLDDKINKV